MSTPTSVVVVGARPADAITAFTLRERGFDGDIVLVGAESQLPYERPALGKSYLAGDVLLDKLLVRSAEAHDEHRLSLRHAATALDVDRRTVRLDSGEVLPYTHLVIATGARNVRPPIPGIGLDGVHQIRTVADADPTGCEQPLIGFFLHGGTVTAVVAVNDGKQFRRAQRLMGADRQPRRPHRPERGLAALGPAHARPRGLTPPTAEDKPMKPFHQIDVLRDARVLDSLAERLEVLSRAVARPRRRCPCWATSTSGHPAHTPCSCNCRSVHGSPPAGWTAYPGTENSAAVLTGIGIATVAPAVTAGLVDDADLGRSSAGSPSSTPPSTPSRWHARACPCTRG